jgi:hypothetical protein
VQDKGQRQRLEPQQIEQYISVVAPKVDLIRQNAKRLLRVANGLDKATVKGVQLKRINRKCPRSHQHVSRCQMPEIAGCSIRFGQA